jgi:hypothetical protein
LTFTLEGLKVIETAFTGDFALKLLKTIEGDTGGVSSETLRENELLLLVERKTDS